MFFFVPHRRPVANNIVFLLCRHLFLTKREEKKRIREEHDFSSFLLLLPIFVLKKRLFVWDFDVSSLSLWRSALTSASHVTRCRSNGGFHSLRLLQRALTPATSFLQTLFYYFFSLLLQFSVIFLLLFSFSVVDLHD